jgi:hypothetical protein
VLHSGYRRKLSLLLSSAVYGVSLQPCSIVSIPFLDLLSILKVHTRHMQEAGRLLVRDTPEGTAAAKRASSELSTYSELLQTLVEETEGFSGASLAAVTRAAHSKLFGLIIKSMTLEDNTLLCSNS